MKNEHHSIRQEKGWIEVVCGSMFSGKTEELIRRLRRAQFAQLNVVMCKPVIDNRYHKKDVVSHDENSFPGIAVNTSIQILDIAHSADVVGVDEAQFFDHDLVKICNKLADAGKRVIIAGLDMDFKGKPFGPVPQLLAVAEQITKLHAICVVCGNEAQFSYRKSQNDEIVELGEKGHYMPLCRKHFNEQENV